MDKITLEISPEEADLLLCALLVFKNREIKDDRELFFKADDLIKYIRNEWRSSSDKKE